MAESFEPIRTEQDVEEVLRLAVRQHSPEVTNLRERLTSTAAELGISPEALAKAEKEWQHTKQMQVTEQLELDERVAFRKSMLGELYQHAATYVVTSLGLFWLDARNGSITWAYIPAVFWGGSLVLGLARILLQSPRNEQAFRRWQKRNARRSA